MYLPRISETIFLGSVEPLFKKWSVQMGIAQIAFDPPIDFLFLMLCIICQKSISTFNPSFGWH